MAPPTLSSTLSPTLPRVPSPPPAARQPQVRLAEPLAGHWHGGDAFRTHLFNALSLMFPQGERSFIDTVREFLPHLAAEPHLRAQVLGFIGQEGTHARVHRGYNERLAELGFVDRLQARLERRIRLTRRWLRPLDRLAITVAYEHYTAVLAGNLLANPAVLRGAHPQLALLWGWHAVAFDVYRRCGGGYLRRLAAGLYASFFLALDLLVQVLGLLRDDRQRA
ncbi:MAG: metal-dependent hydrolase, partial [Burkholderiales bacterium]|nr:metal-dependent hydrolase [Burkholderiales bacterium]